MIKIIKQNFAFLLLGSLLSILVQPLLGDSLYLKDGKKINGFFIKQDQRGILFETLAGKKQLILLQNAKRLAIGSPGVTGCYWSRVTKKRMCNIIVKGIGKKKLLFFSDKEGKKLKKIRLNTVSKVKVYRETRYQQITPILRKNQRIKVLTRKKSITGKIHSLNSLGVHLISKKGKKEKIYDRDIQELHFFSDPSVYKKYIYFSPYMFLPGGAQFARGQYWKGSFFLISTLTFIATYGWQVAEGREILREAERSSGTGTVSDIIAFEAPFRRSQRIQFSLLGVAIGIYCVNLIDALFFPGKKIRSLYATTSPSRSNDSSPINGLRVDIIPVLLGSNENRETGVHIRLNTSF